MEDIEETRAKAKSLIHNFIDAKSTLLECTFARLYAA